MMKLLSAAKKHSFELPGSSSVKIAAGLLLLMFSVFEIKASAQTDSPADRGGLNVYAGVMASSFAFQYGERKIPGAAAFIDIAGKSPLGLEAEARWLGFHQTQDVHATTWLVGPRYRWKSDRYQLYIKGLAGSGDFTSPYIDAPGHYLVLAPGGGVDFKLGGRVRVRLVDVEYQYWPEFNYYTMTSYGISAGLRIRIY